MTVTRDKTRRLRFYQGRFDVTIDFNLGFHGEPHPERVTARVFFTPDEAVYYASANKMIELNFLDYQAEFPEGVEVDEEHIEAWENDVNGAAFDPVYAFPWSRVVKRYGYEEQTLAEEIADTQPKDIDIRVGDGELLLDATYQGAYDLDEGRDEAWEQAREDAQGNWLV